MIYSDLEILCLIYKLSGSRGEKKGKQNKFESHSTSSQHITSMNKWSAFCSSKSKGDIHEQLSSVHSEQVKKNREYIKVLIDITLFLARQSISFRGHRECEDSENQGK